MENRLFKLMSNARSEWNDKAWKAAAEKSLPDFRGAVSKVVSRCGYLDSEVTDAYVQAKAHVKAGRPESVVLSKPETAYSTTPPSNFNPPTYPQETNIMNTKAFTVVEYIYGVPTDKITEQGCIDAIKRVEGEMDSLRAIDAPSTKISDMLQELENQRDSIVTVLDGM